MNTQWDDAAAYGGPCRLQDIGANQGPVVGPHVGYIRGVYGVYMGCMGGV